MFIIGMAEQRFSTDIGDMRLEVVRDDAPSIRIE
jgi:hypothetical protein